ncbi:hypothetical protein HIM_11855 [Hirsutella minnesotensis 3608]|uniref:DNA helicase Pif1-like 2B domain-containing protein n=1 Tax=Hirsutella minnesotensis 3608 TaxID=1043627 RepID=A0A0F7ZWD0_9HYPO|nr:hypothetical protein HIM_11855 [Hirsutella minnesotensis 3608]
MAKNVGPGSAAAPDDKAGNLAKQIPVCIGARLMLTSNLWQPVGLCNGARGTVYDIAWAPGADPMQDPPCVIMMEFDKYTGPVFLTTADGRKIGMAPDRQVQWRSSITSDANANPMEIQYRDSLPDDVRSGFDKAVEALPQEHLRAPATGDEVNSPEASKEDETQLELQQRPTQDCILVGQRRTWYSIRYRLGAWS